MRRRPFTAITASVLLAVSTLSLGGTATAQPQDGKPGLIPVTAGLGGSFALSGQKASRYVVPADVVEVWSTSLPGGRTQIRYQQMAGPASVFGGQITLIRDAAGRTQSVVGAHFPGVRPRNRRGLDKSEARQVAEARIGEQGAWSNELRLDPRTGRLFYEIESIRNASRPVRWVDAATGAVIKAFDALADGEGEGVKGDSKSPLDTTRNSDSGRYLLRSADGRQVTYTARNGTGTVYEETDDDDVWDLNNGRLTSPSQAPGVDAHYYANVVDDFYTETFGRNSIDDQGMPIVSIVHFGSNYCNAFWNGAFMTYGDGNGTTCLPLSGGLDVDGHELTHGVTEYTSGLIYLNESGALNEAFSDIMGNTIEFYAGRNGLDPAARPDFRVGEDVVNTADPSAAGIRNMKDPAEFGDPDHMVDKYTGARDNGGVHINSGIANHAYFLLARGGRNRGCSLTDSRAATHTEDCDVRVSRLGLGKASQIFYAGFTSLPEHATFCDARNATTAVVEGPDRTAVESAWDAVGVYRGCEEGTPPPPPCEGDLDASLPIESPHPYRDNSDCTWVFDNGTGGFRFHFSLLETEAGYDFVYVKDGDGEVLDTFHGSLGSGVVSSCIGTSTGAVQLVSDESVTMSGFTIDSVEPCLTR